MCNNMIKFLTIVSLWDFILCNLYMWICIIQNQALDCSFVIILIYIIYTCSCCSSYKNGSRLKIFHGYRRQQFWHGSISHYCYSSKNSHTLYWVLNGLLILSNFFIAIRPLCIWMIVRGR